MTATNSKYNAQWFLNFFKSIPEEDWTSGSWDCGGKRCAMGHLGWDCMAPPEDGESAEKGLALTRIMNTAVGRYHTGPSVIVNINDDGDHRYKQSTPRQRVVAALIDARDKDVSQVPGYQEDE